MFDVIIIGGGPAGLSAGIYSIRAGAETLIIAKDDGALAKARRVDNYFGTDGTVSGPELLQNAKKQYVSLGGKFINAEVVAAEAFDGFKVMTSEGDFESKALILAVGKSVTKPVIKGEEDFIGRGVSRCAVCDGFFFRNKRVGVIGSGEYAKSEARQLEPFTSDITLFTNGTEIFDDGEFSVNVKKLSEIRGDVKVTAVVTEDGEEIPLDGLFIASRAPGAFEFALKLGIGIKDGYISVDKDMSTAIKGLFAAGDCIGGLNQISTAVGEGAVAGQRAAEFIKIERSEKK